MAESKAATNNDSLFETQNQSPTKDELYHLHERDDIDPVFEIPSFEFMQQFGDSIHRKMESVYYEPFKDALHIEQTAETRRSTFDLLRQIASKPLTSTDTHTQISRDPDSSTDTIDNYMKQHGIGTLSALKARYSFDSILSDSETFTVLKVKDKTNDKFKVLKVYKYKHDDKEDMDIPEYLTKWSQMTECGVIGEEYDIYYDQTGDRMILTDKTCDINLKQWILDNPRNNMFRWTKNIGLFVKEIVNKIQKMHSNDIVFGDLNPENIWMNMNDDGTEPIEFGFIDFGCCIDGRSDDLMYTAPEMQQYAVTVSDKIDVYSLGVIILELLRGRHPYHKKLKKRMNDKDYLDMNGWLKECELNDMLRKHKVLNHGENKDLKDLISNMMEWDNNKRFGIDDVIKHKWFQKYCI